METIGIIAAISQKTEALLQRIGKYDSQTYFDADCKEMTAPIVESMIRPL
jgi:hypothetical protein